MATESVAIAHERPAASRVTGALWAVVRWGTLLALAAIVLLGAGCTAAPDRTGGVRLEIDIRDAGSFAALYRLDTAGSLGWAGGEDALKGEVAWQAALIIDGTKLASFMAKPGRIRIFTDLAANVSNLSGMHQVGVRLELVGV